MSLKAAFMLGALKKQQLYLDDQKSQMIAAFSLSPLFITSTLSLRLRRDSDNSEQDFGFVSGTLDISAINTFANGANLFISKWYDQTGNGNDQVNATTANQPGFNPTDQSIIVSGSNKTLLLDISQALPYTAYLYCKQNTYSSGSQYVKLGGGLNGIVQQFNNLTLVAANDWIGLDASNNRKYSLFRYSLPTSGDTIIAMDKEPIGGTDTRFPTGTAGTAPIGVVQLGGSTSPNFNAKALILTNNTVNKTDHQAISNYFSTVFNTTLNQTLLAFGDSITAGRAATDPSLSYVGLLTTNLPADKYNYGIANTVVGYNVASNNKNLVDLYNTVELGEQKGYLTFCYGTNDGTTDVAWKSFYKNLIQYFIDLGYDLNKMCLITPPYNSTFAYLPQTVAYCSEIASELNIRYADCYTYMENNGGDSLLADGLHPNNAGHAAMDLVIEQSLT